MKLTRLCYAIRATLQRETQGCSPSMDLQLAFWLAAQHEGFCA